MTLNTKPGTRLVPGSQAGRAIRKMNQRTARLGWLLFVKDDGRYAIQKIDDPEEARQWLELTTVPELNSDVEAVESAANQALRGEPLMLFLLAVHGRHTAEVPKFEDAIGRLLNVGPARGAVLVAKLLTGEA
jgi:hypothetical protein